MKGKACRNCRNIIAEGDSCPLCKNNSFTTFWKGYAVILNPVHSQIAQKMGIDKEGKFALRLSR